jgi:hypothetical protein
MNNETSATVIDINMPRPPSNSVQVALRIPEEWIKLADALVPRLSRPGVNMSRTDVFRAAMARGFQELEQEAVAQEDVQRRRSTRDWHKLVDSVEKYAKAARVAGLKIEPNQELGSIKLSDKTKSVTVADDTEAWEVLLRWAGSDLDSYLVDLEGELIRDTPANRKRMGR